MQKRIDFAFNILGGVVTLLVLFFAITSVISQFQKRATAVNGTQTNVPASALQVEHLLAFTSEMDGNTEIYTVHPDGSGQTNLTENPAHDANPLWTPDGKRIVFESDRTGISQLYVMNADGSNVVQITNEDAEHHLLLTGDDRFKLWSSDGSRFLFLQKDSDSRMNSLFSMDINGENKILLASDTRNLDDFSYSPSGEYVGYVLWDKAQPDGFVPNLYIVNASGSNPQELSKYLSQDEHSSIPYFWASDGRSIIFPASMFGADHLTIYQLDLQTNVLSALTTTTASLYDWYDGIVVGLDYWHGGYVLYDSNRSTPPLFWQRPDGTRAELDIQNGADPANCYISKARSLQGNLAIGSYCKRDDKISLYWTNVDGSQIQPLPDVKVPALDGSLIFLTLSPDEKFLTFNFESKEVSSLYIWDMEDALNDPLSQPIKLPVSNQDRLYIPSWRPIVEDLTEIEPTSEPEKTAPDNRLITFTSRQSGNYEIYTVRSDGSDVRNITNDPARDVNPAWSPDGKRIAFQSDRSNGGYYSQIFLMDVDGSNVILLTTDKGNHELPLNFYSSQTNPWSPDGSKLLFLRQGLSEGEWILQSIDINTGNITSLVTGRVSFSNISWSPDGKHIGFVLNDPQNTDPGAFVPQPHIVNADGSSLININKLLQAGESLYLQYTYTYNWSRDGRSVFLITSNVPVQGSYGFGSDSTNPYYWKVYEANLNDGTLTLHATTHSPISNWWQGTYLVTPMMGSGGWTWVYPDGSVNTINPTKECEQERLYDSSKNSYTSAVGNFSPSPNGNGVIIASCPDGNVHLSWINSDGTEITPITKLSTAPVVGYMDWVQWSQDDQFIAFHLTESDATDVYIVNLTESLKDPSIPLTKISLEIEFPFLPAWQPVSNAEVAEENPTPEPKENSSSSANGLIAFTSEKDGNTEIYTMRADSSEVANITNDSANDNSPAWSPNGQKLAFTSERNGNSDIFVMNPDGSSLTQLTDNPGFDGFANWSPDGQKIAYLSSTIGDPNVSSRLFVMNADGSDKVALTDLESYIFLGWSPNGQKFVYLKQNSETNNPQDDEVHVVAINDTNHYEWRAIIDEIKWIDDEHFIGHGWSGASEPPSWRIYKFDANGSDPVEIATTPGRVVALFDQTYLVEDVRTFAWYSTDGNTTPLNSQEFSAHCKKQGDRFLQDTGHTISPDETRAFVTIYCSEGTTWFYLENSDGSQFVQLTDFSIANPEQTIGSASWSPDGNYVTVTIASRNGGTADIYLFDIQQMLSDPSTQPIPLTTDGVMKYSVAWQPNP